MELLCARNPEPPRQVDRHVELAASAGEAGVLRAPSCLLGTLTPPPRRGLRGCGLCRSAEQRGSAFRYERGIGQRYLGRAQYAKDGSGIGKG